MRLPIWLSQSTFLSIGCSLMAFNQIGNSVYAKAGLGLQMPTARSQKSLSTEEATMLFRTTLLASCAMCAISGMFHGAEAQPYPSRSITLVVPFPAGGPTDTIGRIMAEGLRT